jgi:hypothetical protein
MQQLSIQEKPADCSCYGDWAYSWYDRRTIVRIPTQTTDFSPFQNVHTGSAAHPASYSIRTADTFPGIKLPRRETDYSPPSGVEIKNEWSLPPSPVCLQVVWTPFSFLLSPRTPAYCHRSIFISVYNDAPSVLLAIPSGSVLVADVRQADRARSGHVVLEADIFIDKEDDTITWL